MDMNIDLKLKLLAGDEFIIPNLCSIKPFTLREIKDIGLTVYNFCIHLFTSDIEQLKNEQLIKENEEYSSTYEFLYKQCILNLQYKNIVVLGLNSILREKVEYDYQGFYISKNNEKLHINNDIFGLIILILKYQHNLVEKEKKYANDKAIEFEKKLQQLRQKYKKNKKESEELTFDNIISSVCSKHPSYNHLNIWDLTMYQLMDTFKRLNMIDEYFVTLESLIHGASSEDTKLRHWSLNIDN